MKIEGMLLTHVLIFVMSNSMVNMKEKVIGGKVTIQVFIVKGVCKLIYMKP